MPVAPILRLARTIRCATVDSGVSVARAICAVVRPQIARSVSASCASGESAGWQHPKSSGSRSSGSSRTVFRRHGLGFGEQRELLAVALLAAYPVERVVAGRLREPSARIGRHTARAPLPHGFLDRLGDRFLSEVEAAEPTGERRDDARRLLAKHTREKAIGCRGPVLTRIRHRGILLAHCSMWL